MRYLRSLFLSQVWHIKKRPYVNRKRKDTRKKKTRVRGHRRGLPGNTGSGICMAGFFIFMLILLFGGSWLKDQFTIYPIRSSSILLGSLICIGFLVWLLMRKGTEDVELGRDGDE